MSQTLREKCVAHGLDYDAVYRFLVAEQFSLVRLEGCKLEDVREVDGRYLRTVEGRGGPLYRVLGGVLT